MPKGSFWKLVKYNGKMVAEEMIAYYILLIISAVLARLCEGLVGGFVPAIIKGFAEGFFFSMLFTTVINSIIRSWRQFNQTMYGPESYLTHALPVKTTTILWAMVVMGALATATSMILSVVAVLLAFAGTDSFETLMLALSETIAALGIAKPLFFMVLALVAACEMWAVFIIGIFADIVGHLFNSGQIGRAIVVGFAAYAVVQLLIFGLIYCFAEMDGELNTLFGVANSSFANLDSILAMGAGGYALVIAGFAFSSRQLVKRGVNVE